MRSPGGLKLVAFWVFMMSVSTGIAEGIGQLVYRATTGRWLSQWWAVPIYESDEAAVYRVRRHLAYEHRTTEYDVRYFTDSHGFRCDELAASAQATDATAGFRMLYLGPSFTFGWGVDYADSYVALLSQKLHAGGTRLRTINAGVPAQPMAYQLRWLRRVGPSVAPDLIVQTVYGDCCRNVAVTDELPAELPYVRDGYLYPPAPRGFAAKAVEKTKSVRRYSTLLFYGWRLYAQVVTASEPTGMGQELEVARRYDRCSEAELVGSYRQYQQFVDRALGRAIPVVFLYVPYSYVVRPADIVRVRHHGNHRNPLVEREYVRTAGESLQRNGIQFVDLTDALVAADRGTRMYYLYDIHFTPAGNRVAASVAAPVIQRAIDAALGRSPQSTRQSYAVSPRD